MTVRWVSNILAGVPFWPGEEASADASAMPATSSPEASRYEGPADLGRFTSQELVALIRQVDQVISKEAGGEGWIHHLYEDTADSTPISHVCHSLFSNEESELLGESLRKIRQPEIRVNEDARPVLSGVLSRLEKISTNVQGLGMLEANLPPHPTSPHRASFKPVANIHLAVDDESFSPSLVRVGNIYINNGDGIRAGTWIHKQFENALIQRSDRLNKLGVFTSIVSAVYNGGGDIKSFIQAAIERGSLTSLNLHEWFLDAGVICPSKPGYRWLWQNIVAPSCRTEEAWLALSSKDQGRSLIQAAAKTTRGIVLDIMKAQFSKELEWSMQQTTLLSAYNATHPRSMLDIGPEWMIHYRTYMANAKRDFDSHWDEALLDRYSRAERYWRYQSRGREDRLPGLLDVTDQMVAEHDVDKLVELWGMYVDIRSKSDFGVNVNTAKMLWFYGDPRDVEPVRTMMRGVAGLMGASDEHQDEMIKKIDPILETIYPVRGYQHFLREVSNAPLSVLSADLRLGKNTPHAAVTVDVVLNDGEMPDSLETLNNGLYNALVDSDVVARIMSNEESVNAVRDGTIIHIGSMIMGVVWAGKAYSVAYGLAQRAGWVTGAELTIGETVANAHTVWKAANGLQAWVGAAREVGGLFAANRLKTFGVTLLGENIGFSAGASVPGIISGGLPTIEGFVDEVISGIPVFGGLRLIDSGLRFVFGLERGAVREMAVRRHVEEIGDEVMVSCMELYGSSQAYERALNPLPSSSKSVSKPVGRVTRWREPIAAIQDSIGYKWTGYHGLFEAVHLGAVTTFLTPPRPPATENVNGDSVTLDWKDDVKTFGRTAIDLIILNLYSMGRHIGNRQVR